MRLRDAHKREMIIGAAAKLFSSQAFHKVRLEDVASAAGVGKGTVYIYFTSKEDLFYSLIYDGFAQIVDGLKEQLQIKQCSISDQLRLVVQALVGFSLDHPQLYEVMRTAGAPTVQANWNAKRVELIALIEDLINRGIKAGELADSHPPLTAQYIASLIRSAMMYGPRDLDGSMLVDHMLNFIQHGLSKREIP